MFRTTIQAVIGLALLVLAPLTAVEAMADGRGISNKQIRSVSSKPAAKSKVAKRSGNFRSAHKGHKVTASSNLSNGTKVSKKAVARKSVKSTRKVARKSRSSGTHRAISRKATPSIVAAVKRHARANGVPVRVALAVVRQESNFRPHVTGSAGEIGLMQLKCRTARGEGFKGSCKSLYNVDTNLRYGMRYLKKALRRGSVGYFNAGIYAKRLPAAAKSYARSVASLY